MGTSSAAGSLGGMRPGRWILGVAIACAVLVAGVVAYRAATAPGPGPSLGPVVRVSAHPASTPQHTAAPATRPDDDEDDGATAVTPRTPRDAGDDDGGRDDDPDEAGEDRDDVHDAD